VQTDVKPLDLIAPSERIHRAWVAGLARTLDQRGAPGTPEGSDEGEEVEEEDEGEEEGAAPQLAKATVRRLSLRDAVRDESVVDDLRAVVGSPPSLLPRRLQLAPRAWESGSPAAAPQPPPPGGLGGLSSPESSKRILSALGLPQLITPSIKLRSGQDVPSNFKEEL
jgi:hypothetical protein